MQLCDWLPDSGYQADEAPPIEIYGKDFAMDEKTGCAAGYFHFAVAKATFVIPASLQIFKTPMTFL